MNGTLKISVVVFTPTNAYQNRVNAKKVNLLSEFCTKEEARSIAKEWIKANKEVVYLDRLIIVFMPDPMEIDIDELY